jgi:hypothetical protein
VCEREREREREKEREDNKKNYAQQFMSIIPKMFDFEIFHELIFFWNKTLKIAIQIIVKIVFSDSKHRHCKARLILTLIELQKAFIEIKEETTNSL